MVKMFMRPVWVGGASGYRYDVEFDGQVVVSRSRVPVLDAARWCAGQGKDGILEVWRYGGSGPCMIAEIGKAATRTILENERHGPRFVKWHPFERTAVDAA